MPNAKGTAPVQRILIADDSATERLHLEQILANAGYEVIQATSGNEARRLAETQLPDLILLDILMEDGDGFQTCRALRRNPATRNIPIIMVSSKANTVDKQWAEKLGANAYIVKPFTADDVFRHIAAL